LQIATSFESAIDFSAVKEYITVLPSDRCPSTVWLYPFLVGCVGKAVEKGQKLLRGDLFDGSITELPDIAFNDGPVGSHRIFFPMGLVAIDPNFGWFG
jgi:hypothetical protein